MLTVITAQRVHPRLKHLRWLKLEPMGQHEIRTVLDRLLPLEGVLAVRLAKRARGNPQLGVALLTDLVGRDALQPAATGYQLRTRADAGLPDDLHAITERQIDSIAGAGSERRDAWEAAAILGTDFAMEEWTAVCKNLDLGDVDGAADALIARRWASRGRGRFAIEPVVQEALMRAATEAGRHIRIHDAVAGVLEDSNELARLGHHLASAGRSEDALEPLRKGASNLVNAGQVAPCLAAIDRWHEVADAAGYASDDPARAKLHRIRAHLAFHIEEDALELLERALVLVEGIDPEEEVRVRYSLGHNLRRKRDFTRSVQNFEYALSLDPEPLMQGLCILGIAEGRFDNSEDGRAEVEQAREIFAVVSPELVARCDVVLGRGLSGAPDTADEAIAALERGMSVARDVGWQPLVAQVYNDLAGIAVARGDFDLADSYFEAAIGVFRESGSTRWVEVTVMWAAALIEQRRHDDARRLMKPVRVRYWHELDERTRGRAEEMDRELG